MRKSIAIHGAVYGRNFGDIIIIETVLKSLARSGHCDVSIPMGFSRFIDYINRGSNVVGRNRYPSVIIFGPGGYLGQPRYNTLRWNIRFMMYHGFIILASFLFRIPVVIHGTGVGPATFHPVRLLMKLLFMRAERIHVRDVESSNYVKELYKGVNEDILTFGGDVALALPHFYGIEPIDINHVAGVIGIHMPVGDKIGFPDELADDLLTFVAKHNECKFNILHDGPAQEVHSKLKGLLSFEHVSNFKFEGPEELISQINQCELIITTKLHVGICAYALGKKIISTYTHPKNKRFFQQIERRDNSVFIEDYQPGWLSGMVAKTLADCEFHEKLNELSSQVKVDLGGLIRVVEKINGN